MKLGPQHKVIAQKLNNLSRMRCEKNNLTKFKTSKNDESRLIFYAILVFESVKLLIFAPLKKD